ncbi:hypothetical protein QEJ31_01945 [Pigmentibacter sp. JX0631]|uniref:tetratricopeptide repeat protein n=1 Tax=Pigmentibacter sp. JX0631 TaxID=2976982 RepID=UPI0024696C8C|nr:hypothetical protein [Pigmentibacter sp. JX0631]WGL60365.1 hypothetical protein QEJ31_01945 [Pigmentibacter sp. JX0631]
MLITFREKIISPFINLSSNLENNITSQAITFWLKQKKYNNFGATMVLHPNTREQYKDNCKLINDEYTIKIVNNYLQDNFKDQCPEEICLYQTRLLYYLGIYKVNSIQLSKLLKSKKSSIQDWASYLIYLEKYVLNTKDFKFCKSNIDAIETNEVKYHMKFLLMNSYSQNLNIDSRKILDLLEAEISEWQEPESINKIYFQARKLRYQSLFFFCSERFLELIELSEQIKKITLEVSLTNYLEVESLRRLLFYYCTRLCLIHKYEQALFFIPKLIEIDPFCSAVHTLRGMIEENLGMYPLAKNSYQFAYSIGFSEKSFCYEKIRKIESSNKFCDDLSSDLKKVWSTDNKYQSFKYNENDLFDLIKQSNVYKKYPSLWSFEKDTNSNSPFWYRQISNAIDVIELEKDLFFESCYFQSLQPYHFKARMTISALQEIGLLNKFSVFDIQNFSIMQIYSSNNLIESLQEFLKNKSSNSLKACYYSRLLLYLGLEKDANNATSWVWNIENWDINHCYLVYTNLLLSYRSGNDLEYFDKCYKAYLKFPDCDETLRLKLMMCIQCGGYFGKNKELEKVKHWYFLGKEIIEKIISSTKFTEHEKIILHSRWYRFSSFIPYLEKNYNLLSQETNLYIKLSEEAYAKNPSAITLENLYAVYETRARTAEFLGKKEEAYEWFLKLRNEIDPYDSKVEINLGDMQEKIGSFQKAYTHFEKAYRNGPPLRDMALLKMAQIDQFYEKNWRSIFLYSQYQDLVPTSKIAEKNISDLSYKIIGNSVIKKLE